MIKEIIPRFKSHYSIGKSILTLEDVEDKIDTTKPVSIFSIAKFYGLKQIYLADTSFSGFIQFQKGCEKLNIQGIFGIEMCVCADMNDKSDDSLKTESKVIIWMKNSAGYKDLLKIYSKGATDGFYYNARISWCVLKEYWTDNLLLTVPFYDGFLANNILIFDYNAIPDFGEIKPIFEISPMGLPFDDLISNQLKKYTESNGYEIIKTVPCYYYSYDDFKQYCVFRAINNRSVFNAPNIDHLSSNQFCFRKWCELNNIIFNL